LISKLGPTYDRKLNLMMNDIGRFRELPLWRKEFKATWKKAMKKPITMPLNEKYQLDPHRFVCICPQFVISRFLICTHLVQSFHPIHPIFFLQVTRNRTAPFWTHPLLVPIDEVQVRGAIEPICVPTAACDETDGRGDESEDEEEGENHGLIDMAADGYDASRETFAEKMRPSVCGVALARLCTPCHADFSGPTPWEI
jgi:hypothetical protein